MSLSSADSFDFEIDSLTADCGCDDVSAIKIGQNIEHVEKNVAGKKVDDGDIFDMGEIDWNYLDDDETGNNYPKDETKVLTNSFQNSNGEVKTQPIKYLNNIDKEDKDQQKINIKPRLDSGIASISSFASDSSDSDGKHNDDIQQICEEMSKVKANHPSTNNHGSDLIRHLSLENNVGKVEDLPLPQLPKKWVPQFKNKDTAEVRDLLSFWSDKTCLHAPIKRTTSVPGGSLKLHWLEAMEKAKTHEDPWKKYEIIEKCPTERAKRYRYNALKKKWVVDLVYVKIQTESFGQGAMRKCFRMKKLSTRVHQDDWAYAANVVAKRYFEDVLPNVYFDDVKLQMDAKLWAEEYNRHDPPKKIDIIQVACISMIDREGFPMYHVEHFVEGNYKKYNSNSGFVLREEEHIRATPQAFSHFTFERSGHQMIVVDVQGVGDLYTDPQIHTAKADEYGEANLGSKGMALFFATHDCSEICEAMNLERFDLSSLELARIRDTGSRSATSTEVKHHHSHNSLSPQSPGGKMLPMFDLVEKLQSVSSDDINDFSDVALASSLSSSLSSINGQSGIDLYSEMDSGVSTDSDGARVKYFNQLQSKSACVDDMELGQLSTECIDQRLNDLKNYEEMQISILGNIHFDMAVYNSIGRFTDGQPDNTSTLVHLNKAALCGSLEANKIMAAKYFNLPTDQFADLEVLEDHDKGMDCLIEAATRGDKDSIIRTAKAFNTGINLGKARESSWKEAIKWYEAALNVQYAGVDAIQHEIYARMAEMWREGGKGIEKDASYAGELYSNAADAAMAIGKGKMANKYFMYAEDSWAEVED